MEDKLYALLENVVDEASFLAFARALAANSEHAAEPNAAWENATLPTFLDAATAWAESTNFGRRMAFPDFEMYEVSPWRRFAEFLWAGKVYE